jgi:nicotinamide mononucleotide transporter
MSTLSILEIVATLSGIACVTLAARAHILTWPIGIVSVLFFAVFFWQIRLYADAGLQVFFVGTGFYGWWHWRRGGTDATRAPILTLRRSTWWAIIGVCLAATAMLGTALSRYTDASLPYWDSFTTTFSIAAQLLLIRKVFENWILWITVDVVAIGVYATREAYVTAGLYTVFLGLATWGYFSWNRLRAKDA